MTVKPVETTHHRVGSDLSGHPQRQVGSRTHRRQAQMVFPGIAIGRGDDAGRTVAPSRLVAGQTALLVWRRGKAVGQHPGVFQGEVCSLCQKRQGRMGCIPKIATPGPCQHRATG